MKTQLMELPDDVVSEMADALKMLGHPDRLRIIEVLEKGKSVPVGQIEIMLNRPQAVVSHHLGRMKRAGLLESERCGKNVCYRIADHRPLTILNCIRKKIVELKKEGGL